MLNFSKSVVTDNKADPFSINDFIFRLKKLEKICVKDNLDAILLISGSDAKDNSEYTKLINWLFRGLSGVEIEENEYLEAVYHELVLVIKKQSIMVYADPPLFDEIKHLIVPLPNVEIFCPTDKQYNNKDLVDLLKITFFYKSMMDVKKVGVLLGSKDLGKVSNIERWPLIQAFGNEGKQTIFVMILCVFDIFLLILNYIALGQGFFTMNRDVVDMNARINPIYKNHDKYSLSVLAKHKSSLLVS
jgi:hypothetical protein